MRTPLLAFDELLEWSEGIGGTAGSMAADRSLLRARLKELLERSEIREALFVASPRLQEGLSAWPGGPADRKSLKIERALVRYFSRMAARATPFGLFAGCSTGTVDDSTVLEIGPRTNYQKHTRLDMEYLSSLVEELERDAESRAVLEYFPNSSIYRSGGRLRYAEARTSHGTRSHHLVAVDETPYLLATLKRSAAGAPIRELAHSLVDDEISYEDAAQFVEELIESQILVSDLGLPITGHEPIGALVPQLDARPATAKAGGMLDEARMALEGIDAAGLGVEPARYLEVAGLLERLPAPVELGRLFQVDMTKPAPKLTIGRRVVDEVGSAVQILHRIMGRTLGDDPIARFRSAFTERYGDREVALMEALDEEVGVGFEASRAPSAEASPLLAGLVFPAPPDDRIPWERRNEILLQKVIEAAAAGVTEIDLSEADIDDMAVETRPLPGAFSAGVVIAAPPGGIDAGDFRLLLQGVYGPSGARLLGRFCHADHDLRRHVEDHLSAEEELRPDALFAEIVHLPEGRLGNILLRPVLRSYEIPYLGRSGADADHLIPVDDLRVSLAGERIVLRSVRLGKEVVPRLTSAHNYTFRSLGVYRFLCALQSQEVSGGLAWSWGPLDGLTFLPRVRHGRVVLARARWRVEAGELPTVADELEPEHWEKLQKWRKDRGIPRFVSLADSDNELLVDWHNPLLVDSLLALIKQRPRARLVEMWPRPEELCAIGPEGQFTHEIVIPYAAQESEAPRARALRATTDEKQRRFTPGSEWLYAKLYTGTATADRVIRDLVLPVAQGAMSSGDADSWFFIRYGDPGWHLRLRLHGSPEQLASEVIPDLQSQAAELVREGLIWRIQFDTYEREVDRYGGTDAIEPAEQIFHADSLAVAEIVSVLAGDEGMDARWRLTLRGADLLLDDFGLAVSDKQAIVGRLREAFAREFSAGSNLKRGMGQKYREERTGLESLLAPDTKGNPLEAGLRILEERSQPVRAAAEQFRRLQEQGRLTRTLAEIVQSLVHMHANRLLRSANRAQEVVIYDLLDRLYRAQIARGNKAE